MDSETLKQAKRNAILNGEPIPEDIVEWEKNHTIIHPDEFHTIGYGQTRIEDFIERLRYHMIRTVIDTRDNPWSRIPYYTQSKLKHILKENDIDYVHIPELGVPKDHRDNLNKQGDYDNLWKWYDSNQIPKLASIIMRIQRTYAGKYAFMCAESNPLQCHRHRIAKWFIDKRVGCEEIIDGIK